MQQHSPSCIAQSRVDTLLADEVKFNLSLRGLCDVFPTPYSQPTLSLGEAEKWGISDEYGVYLLWTKASACPVHGQSCMRCIYVGKGYGRWRIVKHWRQKDLSPYFPLYFSFRPLMNRQAKYVEQLLLDEHDFDLNKFEKKKGQPPLFFCRDVANDA